MPIDDILAAVAASPTPAALDALGDDVFASIRAEDRMRRAGRTVMVAAMCAASIAGVASAALPARDSGEPGLAPVALAPSTLLAGPSE